MLKTGQEIVDEGIYSPNELFKKIKTGGLVALDGETWEPINWKEEETRFRCIKNCLSRKLKRSSPGKKAHENWVTGALVPGSKGKTYSIEKNYR